MLVLFLDCLHKRLHESSHSAAKDNNQEVSQLLALLEQHLLLDFTFLA